MEDLNLSLVERLWSLEEVSVSSSDEKTHIRKVRFALKTWRAQYKELKSRQDGKNGDIKDMKSDMYQLIGFFSVFQGVLFQGVTQLSIACQFRYIPVALSVASSLGTIFGVSLKFSDLLDIQERSNGDAISIKVLLYYITEIQRQGKDFSFDRPVAGPSANDSALVNSTGCAPGVTNYSKPSGDERWKLKKRHDEEVVKKRDRLEKELENAKTLKYVILVYLFFIGSGFAYVLSVIMCQRY